MTILFIALIFDRLLGEAPDRLHPVCFMGLWAVRCEAWVRGFFASTRLAGAVAALAVILPFALVGAGLVLCMPQGWPAGAVAGVVVYVCLAPRSLEEHALAVARALENGDLPAGRGAVSRMVGRETKELDEHGVARAAVESVGENLVDGVLATLFWAAMGVWIGSVTGSNGFAWAAGLAVAHRAANTLDAMWGRRNERYMYFGTAAARLDDVLAFAPARLSLPVIAIAAFVVHGPSPAGRRAFMDTLRTGWRDRAAHASPNSAWSEAAFAGALRLRLAGPTMYAGAVRPSPYLGDGMPDATADATAAHIRAAVRLMWMTTVLFAFFAEIILI